MSTLDTDGFLSPEVQRYLHECRARYAGWFELVQSINHFGQSLLGEIRINPTDSQQSIGGLLYIRVICHAQGAVLLIERCMPTQGEVLCRASVEALFGLLAVVEKIDTAELLVRADRYHQSDMRLRQPLWSKSPNSAMETDAKRTRGSSPSRSACSS